MQITIFVREVFVLRRQHDNFLYKNVDVTERESSSGSSTHTSSSGATHGGSSGKF